MTKPLKKKQSVRPMKTAKKMQLPSLVFALPEIMAQLAGQDDHLHFCLALIIKQMRSKVKKARIFYLLEKKNERFKAFNQ